MDKLKKEIVAQLENDIQLVRNEFVKVTDSILWLRERQGVDLTHELISYIKEKCPPMVGVVND